MNESDIRGRVAAGLAAIKKGMNENTTDAEERVQGDLAAGILADLLAQLLVDVNRAADALVRIADTLEERNK
jgi:hypothetical protein